MFSRLNVENVVNPPHIPVAQNNRVGSEILFCFKLMAYNRPITKLPAIFMMSVFTGKLFLGKMYFGI